MPRGSKKCAGKTLRQGPRGGLYCIVEGGKKYYVSVTPARRGTPMAAAPAVKAKKKPARPKTPTREDPILRFLLANQKKTNKHAYWLVDEDGSTEFPETNGNVLKTENGRPRPSARKVLDEYPTINHFAQFNNSKGINAGYFMGMRANGAPYWIPLESTWAKAHEELLRDIETSTEVFDKEDVHRDHS